LRCWGQRPDAAPAEFPARRGRCCQASKFAPDLAYRGRGRHERRSNAPKRPENSFAPRSDALVFAPSDKFQPKLTADCHSRSLKAFTSPGRIGSAKRRSSRLRKRRPLPICAIFGTIKVDRPLQQAPGVLLRIRPRQAARTGSHQADPRRSDQSRHGEGSPHQGGDGRPYANQPEGTRSFARSYQHECYIAHSVSEHSPGGVFRPKRTHRQTLCD